MQWIKIEDIKKVEDFDKETGVSHVSYYMKIATPEVEVESDLLMTEREALRRELDDEAIYAMQHFFEDFMFDRVESKRDFTITVEEFEDGSFPIEYNVFSSVHKKQGSALIIMNPVDLSYIAPNHKEFVEGVTKKKVTRIKFVFED